MYTPLLKSNTHLNLKQALLCSACFLLNFTFVQAQKWENFIDSIQPNDVITSLVVDSANDQLVLGGQYIKEVNGQSSCAVYKWSPENGIEILSPFNLDTMNINVVLNIRYQGDSMLVVGTGGAALWYNNKWSSQLLESQSWDIYPYGNNYLISTGHGFLSTNKILGSLVEWDGDTMVNEFQNISAFMSSSPFVHTVIEYKGDLYVGGDSDSDNGGIMDDIMKWDGTKWATVGGGLHHVSQLGGIYDMVVYKDELYIAGLFYLSGDIKENHIARWDGTQWKPVGGGIGDMGLGNGVVEELHVHNGYLYVGGMFTSAGGVPASGVARWDGYEWCGCGSNIEFSVATLTHYRDTLYIGGNFRIIDGDTVSYSARFIGDDFADTCGSTVGIKTIQLEKQSLKGYPNPAKNELNFDFPNPVNQLTQISLYNSVGQLFIKKQVFIFDRKFTLDISMLPIGIYFGEIVTNQKNYVYSFVKE